MKGQGMFARLIKEAKIKRGEVDFKYAEEN